MSNRKACTKCGTVRPLDQFRRRTSSPDGLRAQCKACQAAYEASPAYRDRHSKRRRSRYATDPAYRAKVRAQEAKQTPERRAAYEAKDRKKHPDKYRARKKVKDAIRRGRMPAASTLRCAHCGEPAAQYHHHKGYAREHWRDVIPLCLTCHGIEGRKPLN